MIMLQKCAIRVLACIAFFSVPVGASTAQEQGLNPLGINPNDVSRCSVSIGCGPFGGNAVLGKVLSQESSCELLRVFETAVESAAPKDPSKWQERAVAVFELKSNQIARVSIFEMATSAPKAYYMNYGFKFYRIVDKVEGASLLSSIYELASPDSGVTIETGFK